MCTGCFIWGVINHFRLFIYVFNNVIPGRVVVTVNSVPHDWMCSPLFSSTGLTVQRTKSGKSAFWLFVFYLSRCEQCIVCWWAYGSAVQWDQPCCHPICPGPPTLHVTQIHGFVHQPRCLNALYIRRGQQWIQLQAMECHCLLLLDKQHQTQTGLCELDTIVELLDF